mmetsp:Transcript_32732/g.29014  ORF Transcript_32732/g.29014 Transcript_32732/m.29014 type:complete len:172 (+) Transcript_32732:963-1478(+)
MYSQMPIDKDNKLNSDLKTHIDSLEEKPSGYRKFLTKDEENLDLNTVTNYYLSLCFFCIYIYHMLTKEYLVSYDFIIIIPFIPLHWSLFSQSPLSLLLIFILSLTYCGQFAMFIAWQMKIIANVNNYWTQVFINAIAWVLISNILQNRIIAKAKEFKFTTKYFYEKIKKDY